MGVSASLPKLKFYQAPTSQSSWSKRPFHVSMSSSLWTDLLMVAMLFRLNEFTLAHLVGGFQGFWQSVTVFFAVYDVWETRVLFDSVFKYQDDVVHQVLGIWQWLLLALMATTITPTLEWAYFDALLFSGLKLAHQSIRVFTYLETWRFSLSKRARKAAGVRSIVYVLGWPFYLAALCMLAVGTFSVDASAGMWVVGFFVQRIVWFYLKSDPFPSKYFRFGDAAKAIKTNVPFKTTRYGDWTMLQLGAIVLGFMTVPTTSLGSYGVLTFGYTYVAALNLLSYSMNPEDPNEHALIKGGLREFAWLELFSLGGLAFMGIAVGLRVHLFYPTLVVLPQNRHYTWILCICATVLTMVMFAQEYSHGGQIARLNGGKIVWLKLLVASLYVVVGAIFIGTDSLVVAFVILGLALVSLAVLALQVLNGAFKRQIIKTLRVKLLGHFRAAIVGMVWLTRARRNLKELDGMTRGFTTRQEEEPVQQKQSGDDTSSTTDESQNNIDKKASAQSQPAGTHGVDHKLSVMSTTNVKQPKRHSDLDVLQHQQQETSSTRHRNGSLLHGIKHSVSLGGISDFVSRTTHRTSLDLRTRRLSAFGVNKNDIRVWKIVINERVYAHPRVFVEGNKATKYRVQWSDLFFDVLFVGVVFRLGDLLLAGIGAGYSEKSVHYENVLGAGNDTSFYTLPHDPPRPDAIFIFGSVFVAVWAMWQNKLAYSSKVGTSDVLHKMVDMAQGLAVLLCAVNITTPNQMEDPASGNAYAVAGALLVFQLSMVGLWVELYFTEGKADSRARGTALRNIQRDSLTVLPLLCSFATIATGVSLSVTTFLWALSWFLPFIMRVAFLRFVNDHNAVRDLHRYVIHRLGDGALIVLGEGVLQIIRADTNPLVFAYLTVTLGLFLMTAARIAVWSMDCFTDPSKHAQLLSLDAGLAAYFIRSVSAPALVCMGVAMKKMASIASDPFHDEKYKQFYWLLCGASTISLFCLVITYELHRFSFHRKWRWREFSIMVFLSSFFTYWAEIPVPPWVIVALSLFTWLVAVIVHFFLDDYFLLKEQVKNHNESTAHGMKRTQSNMTHKSSKHARAHTDPDEEYIPWYFRVWRNCLRRKEQDEHDLPPAKVFVPLEPKQPIKINDDMVPHVGLLERQGSVSKLVETTATLPKQLHVPSSREMSPAQSPQREMSSVVPTYEQREMSAAYQMRELSATNPRFDDAVASHHSSPKHVQVQIEVEAAPAYPERDDVATETTAGHKG